MCGITGYIDYKSTTEEKVLINMVASMKHRGPDDHGTAMYLCDNYLVGLGQSRLSVIDTSSAGHQPMTYKHFSIVYNGEIYNYNEIKNILIKLDHIFQSNSDTEVILHAYEQWGTDCVQQFIGMFAFAIYNKKEETIVFFRDRAGVKPLYYYLNDGLILFGSELKALIKHPGFIKEINPESIYLYFKYGYIPAPYSIYKLSLIHISE